eukprot:CAMPEP_0204116096 /NCGR_PEP_ID=MMETSP0361-20130328/5205_1 /ASSEMBLY_ACC=CAM_ASM_000343 /TAXON_ID=268821 /ORGANISM="Scrippsiella Hangoei, Strain SHTV-5" /LENGTH=240 /DNA_ID=CAMNT_0051066835 /DNA_START=8 /DNA_END=730 /DNA_ORIENTATION=-
MRTKSDVYELGQCVTSSSFELPHIGITDGQIQWVKGSKPRLDIGVSFGLLNEHPLWIFMSCGVHCFQHLLPASSTLKDHDLRLVAPEDDVLDDVADSICIHLRCHRASISAQALRLDVWVNNCFWNIDPAIVEATYICDGSSICSEDAFLTINGVGLTCHIELYPRGMSPHRADWCEAVVEITNGPPSGSLTYELSLGSKRVKGTINLQSESPTAEVLQKRSKLLDCANPMISFEIVSLS